MTFFTADDFQVGGINADNYDDMAATLANQKLQRDAKVVYGWPVDVEKSAHKLWSSELGVYDDDPTHKGLLVCIEEIERKPCEHEPIKSHTINGANDCLVPICSGCGVKLKAKWSVVE